MEQTPTGNIHSFESFGTLDGPGIRSVIFLQGCRLRCLYCHNPDTWQENAGTPMTSQALLNRILRYKPYFVASGGGVTVSGGEPLLQTPFVTDLFRLLKKENIHTCLDTSGFSPNIDPALLDELLAYTDLVLLSVKHMDPAEHLRLTGQTNHETLGFAWRLSEHHIPVWLRYVIVPGYTDGPEDIEKFTAFASSLTNVQKIEYLPFHKMGEYKWQALCLPYRLKDVQTPAPAFMAALQI